MADPNLHTQIPSERDPNGVSPTTSPARVDSANLNGREKN
jgi:hypothetical protein